MIMKDRLGTRIVLDQISSYAPDNKVVSMMSQGSSNPSINISLGSLLLVLVYDKVEDRDQDLEDLDRPFVLGLR